MDDTIIPCYCLCDDILKGLGHRDDRQRHLSDAEVLTIAVVAAQFFGGNLAVALLFMAEKGYTRLISASRFNRRLHGAKELLVTVFAVLGTYWKELNSESVYVIDSFPIASCDNIRIKRSRRYKGEMYRGYIPSKRRYFYGLRLHLMVTKEGQPVEWFLTPGEDTDTSGLSWYQFDVPAGAKIIGDKAFNHYGIEDDLASVGIQLAPLRKKNSKRPIPPWETYLRSTERKYIETVGSEITRRFPKSIHAVTPVGFELKVLLFVLAYSIDCL